MGRAVAGMYTQRRLAIRLFYAGIVSKASEAAGARRIESNLNKIGSGRTESNRIVRATAVALS